MARESDNVDFTTLTLGPIQKTTASGTTSGLGYITSTIPSNVVIVGLKTPASINATVLSNYNNDGTYYAFRFINGYNLEAIANTSVSVDVYYAMPS